MKKFLSLLLALTLVLSLVVVPARADGDDFAVSATAGNPATAVSVVKAGTAVTFTATAPSNYKVGTETAIVKSRAWAVNNTTVAGQTEATLNQTFNTAGSYTVSCTFTLEYGTEGSKQETTVTKSTSITVYDCASAVTGVVFNTRTYTEKSGSSYKVYYDSTEASDLTNKNNWGVTLNTTGGYSFDGGEDYLAYADGTLTVKIKYLNNPVENVGISVTPTAISATSLTSDQKSGSTAKTGTKLTFTLTADKSDRTNLAWYYKSSAENSQYVPMSVTKNQSGKYEWLIPDSLSTGTYAVTCFLKESGVPTTETQTKAVCEGISITKDENILTYNPNVAATRGSTVNLSLTFTDKSGNKVDGALSDVAWTITSGTGATLGTKQVSTNGKTASNTLTIPSNASSSYTVTATFKVGGKDYTATYTVTVKSLTATISPIQNNTPVTLYGYNYGYITNNNLVAIAQAALTTARISATVSYVTLNTGSRTNCYIQQTSGASSAYYTYTITGTSIGTASFTGTVYTDKGNYPITFTATVTPISTTYEAQYPEPVAYGNTYRYYVQVPAGASYYYVVGTPNQAITPTDFSQSGKTVYYTTTQSTSLYALTDANFVNGQCTLWIVTKNSSDNKLYYGQLTVYQKNYNINYNGVAGETVQFKHTDFTNFMNEVAQARGDSSKTGSYPYVTFSYVTFDYPSTAQGTLYYNGTAMSTSSYSGAFNSRTQITNLDNITFVPYAKTNAKTVAVTFTLHAVKYGTNGTVVNRDVQYRGTVNISLVREDVTFTVAPGDSVTFTDSDFLNYLRAQSGINYNYNIDYVTFDQSAVDTINGGVLYSGYAGFNAVKPTDRFYYTTTNNYTQNALSDVTFRASTYAKTGTTVYIPFTIYARYGTTGAGTRQVTGTVAVKIAQTMNFVDVKPTDYFYNPVKWAVGKNITKGTSAVTFSPDRTCTRAEIVTFLWRDAGSPMPTISRSPFSDVNYSMGADFYNAILWASQNGITAGTDVSHFSPNKTCTRAEIVTFLWRYAKKPVGYGNNSFTDVNKADHAPYYDAILWAVSKGITNGSTTTTFAPDGTCTRGQAVTFLYRYEGGK